VLKAGHPTFHEVCRRSTLPRDFRGESLGGHIALDAAGDRLYVTNRGHDSIATFAVEGDTIHPLQHVSSGGASPRHFLLLEAERMMLVANEEAGNVTGFRIRDDGTLERTALDLAVPGAVFLLQG
jgi:6-phosphogluconolactonase